MLRWLFASKVRAGALLYPVAWMGVVFVMSSLPGGLTMDESWLGALPDWLLPANTDLLHTPGYAVLALLWCRGLRVWPMTAARGAFLAFVIAFGFGLLMEWQQAAIPGRMASATDLALNAAGALAAVGLYLLGARRVERNARSFQSRCDSGPDDT